MAKTTLEDIHRLRAAAKDFRMLALILVLSWVGRGIVMQAQTNSAQDSSAVLIIVALLFGAIMAVFGHGVASKLGAAMPVLWGLALMVPILNLLALLMLSRLCVSACKRHGVRAGLLGPNLAELDQLERFITSPPPGYTQAPQ